jgi:hypothetical protein
VVVAQELRLESRNVDVNRTLGYARFTGEAALEGVENLVREIISREPSPQPPPPRHPDPTPPQAHPGRPGATFLAESEFTEF